MVSLPSSAVKLSTWQWLASSTPALLPNTDYSILPAIIAVAVLPRLPCIPVLTLGPHITLGWVVTSDLCSHQASCSWAPAGHQLDYHMSHSSAASTLFIISQLMSLSSTRAKPPGFCRTSTTGAATLGSPGPCSLDALPLPCSKHPLATNGVPLPYPTLLPSSAKSLGQHVVGASG